MKRLAMAVGLTLAVTAVPAQAAPVTPTHARQYQRAYAHVRHVFGRRAPGRNIVRNGVRNRHAATDAQVVASLAVLNRMFDPVPRPAYASRGIIGPYNGPTVPVAQPGQSQTPASGLAACIIARESGGNPQATNGQYTGEAQWSPTSWANGGGTQYAPTPLGASAAQQTAVLNSMLAHGQASQWTPYDGC